MGPRRQTQRWRLTSQEMCDGAIDTAGTGPMAPSHETGCAEMARAATGADSDGSTGRERRRGAVITCDRGDFAGAADDEAGEQERLAGRRRVGGDPAEEELRGCRPIAVGSCATTVIDGVSLSARAKSSNPTRASSRRPLEPYSASTVPIVTRSLFAKRAVGGAGGLIRSWPRAPHRPAPQPMPDEPGVGGQPSAAKASRARVRPRTAQMSSRSPR